jgi:CPA1 family monovalent cation:H+ antiporter
LQGLSLPWIIRRLSIVDDGLLEKEELQARVKSVQAALVRLNEFKGKSDDQTLERLRTEFENRIHDLEALAGTGEAPSGSPKTTSYEELLFEALLAERRMILQLRNEHVINDEVLRRIQRDLDLAELRLNRSKDI